MKNQKHCESCKTSVHCCIFKNNNGFTFVSIKDAIAIKKKTGKDFSQFLNFSPLPKKIVNSLKNDDPSLEGSIRFTQLDKKNRILRLKTKKNGYCIFLDSKRRCEIYNIRPNVCRIYPFWAIKLMHGCLKIVPHDVECDCKILESKKKKSSSNFSISNVDSKEIKYIFIDIQKEKAHYKKNINSFIKKNYLSFDKI